MILPPLTHTADGKERLVGVEIEYAGIPLDVAAEAIRALYGGVISKDHDGRYYVRDTEFGEFRLEVDALTLQKIMQFGHQLEQQEGDDSLLNGLREVASQAASAIGEAGVRIVPLEIIAPPVPITQLEALEKLRARLYEMGAKDTHESFYYAFGLHLNPEAPSLEVDSLRRYIQAFLLLYPWLLKIHQVDLARRITPFIDAFPKAYLELVLDINYRPDFEQLVRDYHRENPTRNRALDMLPLFAHIDNTLVRGLYGPDEKIYARPTYHYRLPNCELSDKNWSITKEWKRWLMVEAVAYEQAMLDQMIIAWQQEQRKWLIIESDWVQYVDEMLGDMAR